MCLHFNCCFWCCFAWITQHDYLWLARNHRWGLISINFKHLTMKSFMHYLITFMQRAQKVVHTLLEGFLLFKWLRNDYWHFFFFLCLFSLCTHSLMDLSFTFLAPPLSNHNTALWKYSTLPACWPAMGVVNQTPTPPIQGACIHANYFLCIE